MNSKYAGIVLVFLAVPSASMAENVDLTHLKSSMERSGFTGTGNNIKYVVKNVKFGANGSFTGSIEWAKWNASGNISGVLDGYRLTFSEDKETIYGYDKKLTNKCFFKYELVYGRQEAGRGRVSSCPNRRGESMASLFLPAPFPDDPAILAEKKEAETKRKIENLKEADFIYAAAVFARSYCPELIVAATDRELESVLVQRGSSIQDVERRAVYKANLDIWNTQYESKGKACFDIQTAFIAPRKDYDRMIQPRGASSPRL